MEENKNNEIETTAEEQTVTTENIESNGKRRMKKSTKTALIRMSVNLLGCLIYSFGVSLFLNSYKLASGGVTGIAIMIDELTKHVIGTGWLIIIINVPLFILGIIFFGKKFILNTLVSTLISSGLIELWDLCIVPYMPTLDNILIPAVVGGALYGGGLGLIFRAGSTTGGTDIIVKILRTKFRHLRTGVISMIIDIIIIGTSAFVYKDIDILFYTILSVVVFTVSLDGVLYGGNSAKLVHIVTTAEFSPQICDHILKDLDITATIIEGTGAYSKADRVVIMCVVKSFLYPKLRDIIKEVDPTAFTIVTSAKEIYGEGYKPHDADEL